MTIATQLSKPSTDLKGGIVSRWVRSYKRRKEDAAAREEFQLKVSEAQARLFPSGITNPDNGQDDATTTKEYLSILLKHSPETLEQIIASSDKGPMERHFWRGEVLGGSVRPVLLDESKEEVERFLSYCRIGLGTVTGMHRLATEDPDLYFPDIWKYQSLIDMVLDAHRTGVTCSQEQAEAVAIFLYVKGLHLESPTTIREELQYSSYKEDIEYISQNLESVYRAAPELSQRKIADREFVQSLIELPATVLMDGAL